MKVSEILRKHGLHLKKRLGQHFLVSEDVLARIADSASLTHDEVVVEVGPGIGLLTKHLAQQAGKVIAVELDESMLLPLREVVEGYGNVKIVQGDILGYSAQDLLGKDASAGYKVVANLPYYITSAVIRHFLEDEFPPDLMILTVQWEVAKRITARPPDMSLLSVSVQVYGEPSLLFKIPPGAFLPPPKVDSGVVAVRRRETPIVPPDEVDWFFRVVKAGFSQRRKQIHNSLSGGLRIPQEAVKAALRAASVAPSRRPGTLSVEEWLSVSRSLRTQNRKG
jgi:16S rRNA (adenine1518-N6/adenine1519-N6)-dimethyltransferase